MASLAVAAIVPLVLISLKLSITEQCASVYFNAMSLANDVYGLTRTDIIFLRLLSISVMSVT